MQRKRQREKAKAKAKAKPAAAATMATTATRRAHKITEDEANKRKLSALVTPRPPLE